MIPTTPNPAGIPTHSRGEIPEAAVDSDVALATVLEAAADAGVGLVVVPFAAADAGVGLVVVPPRNACEYNNVAPCVTSI
ncbi:MAG: hypothetical protein LH628_02120, partial [Microcoleus sp. CAN_BIN18]|nr:hypothetical protein [Microcoleus sp. CAN_BIN18]